MGLFNKKKYNKNVTRDNEFLKTYAIKVHGLLLYTEDNAKVTKELKMMMDDFQYTVATADTDAKGMEKKITKEFDSLTSILQQDTWDESEALMCIRNIRRLIVEINSMR